MWKNKTENKITHSDLNKTNVCLKYWYHSVMMWNVVFFLINKNNKLCWPNHLETLKILGFPANSVFTFLFLFIHRLKRKINFPAFFLFKIPKRSQFTEVDNILSKPKKHQFLWKLDSLQDSSRTPGLHMSFNISRTIHCTFFKFIISDSKPIITFSWITPV